MPIYCPTLHTIDISTTKQYIVDRQINICAELLAEACTKALTLSVPKGIWQLYTYDQDEHTILADKPLTLITPSLIQQMSGAVEVAVMGATIGLDLEQEVSNLFMKDLLEQGILLDAAGTTAINATSNAVYNIISQQAAQAGLIAGNRLCPGQGDCPLNLQPEIINLSEGTDIGLSFTDTKQLVPRKSITAIIGLYPYHHMLTIPQQQDLTCEKCDQPGCQARKGK